MIPNTLPKSLLDNPRLSHWIGFEEAGRVRLCTGKVEIGQGILTALVQIAAEELDVSPLQVRIVSGDTDGTPGEGTTSGSNSTDVSGGAIRFVCAEVRALALDAAAQRLGCDADALSLADGRVRRAGQDTGDDYWSLALDLDRDARANAPTKRREDYRFVGTNVPRLDLPAKVAGAAFIHDIAPDDVIHARMLRPARRGARLVLLDEAAIGRRAPDVQIVRDGDLVAILAERESAALAAVEAARAHAVWDGGVDVPDEADAPSWLMAQPAKTRVIEPPSDHPAREPDGRTVVATFSRPYLAHASIGLVCALARYEDGRLTVWTQSQGVSLLRAQLAVTLKLDPANVVVLHRQGAGCYGHNGADDAAFDAAFLAMRKPGRTVRVQWTREDEFACAPVGAATTLTINVALDASHRPAAWTMEIWSPIHANRPGMNGHPNLLGAAALPDATQPLDTLEDVADAIGGGATRNAYPFYDLPRQRIVHHCLQQVPVRTSSVRGLGAFCNVFAIEGVMDDLAEIAGEDSVRYRLSLQSDPRARRVIEAAAQMSGWFGAPPAGEGAGRGFGFARYKNKAAYMAVVAEVSVDESVQAHKIWAAVDAGLAINPDGVKSQVEGGIIQAVSWTLKERVALADGSIASRRWEDYPILRFSEVPEVEVILVGDPQDQPLGVGEVAQGPTAAALGNAVARALGTRIRHLPLTRERIMSALLEG